MSSSGTKPASRWKLGLGKPKRPTPASALHAPTSTIPNPIAGMRARTAAPQASFLNFNSSPFSYEELPEPLEDTAESSGALPSSAKKISGNFMSAGNIPLNQRITNRTAIPPAWEADAPKDSVLQRSRPIWQDSQETEEVISIPALLTRTLEDPAPRLPPIENTVSEPPAAVFASGQHNIGGGNFMSAANINLNQHIATRTAIPPPAWEADAPEDSVLRPSRHIYQASQDAEEVISIPAPLSSAASSTVSSHWGASTTALMDPWAACDPRPSRWDAPQMEKSISYTDKPVMNDFDPAKQATPDFVDVVRDQADIAGPSGPAIVPPYVKQAYTLDMEHNEAAEYNQGRFEKPNSSQTQEQWEVAAFEPHNEPEHSYTLPSYPVQEVWGGMPVVNDYKGHGDTILGPIPPPSHKRNGSVDSSQMSPTSSIRSGHTADPSLNITYTPSDALHMPASEVAAENPQMPEKDCRTASGATTAFLPSWEGDVIPHPSQPTYYSARDPFRTEYVPDSKNAYPPWITTRGFIPPMELSIFDTVWEPHSTYTTDKRRLDDLGWLEYHLPDGTTYYVDPIRRITADCNLRAGRVFTAVLAYLEDNKVGSPRRAGSEMWLRDVGTPEKGFVPARSWVDHSARAVVADQAEYGAGKGKKVVEEDQLDVEYRYWSFIEAHPAYNPLPSATKAEALDVLNWAWTDRLLPSPHAVPALFTPEECQELMTLLQSFGHDESWNENGFQSRIVSRILLRLAQWRQLYYRPNKPLPKDTSTGEAHLPTHRRTILRSVANFISSCVNPRIPYTFIERVRNSRLGKVSSLCDGNLTVTICAFTFLVAAIAPKYVRNLPPLNGVWAAGIAAILFALFSMAATVAAILASSDIRAMWNGM